MKSLEEIEERYRPYQDQIDGLEGINMLLRNQTSSAQSEAQKLSEQYSRLLGHQNQKQKIQHVKKLKDENASLKQVCVGLLAISCHSFNLYSNIIGNYKIENRGKPPQVSVGG